MNTMLKKIIPIAAFLLMFTIAIPATTNAQLLPTLLGLPNPLNDFEFTAPAFFPGNIFNEHDYRGCRSNCYPSYQYPRHQPSYPQPNPPTVVTNSYNSNYEYNYNYYNYTNQTHTYPTQQHYTYPSYNYSYPSYNYSYPSYYYTYPSSGCSYSCYHW